MILNNASFVSSLNDSGITSKCGSCEETEKCLEDTKKELVSNIFESKIEINNLKEEVYANDIIIKQLEAKIKHEVGVKDKLKKERDTRSFQLKEKNKSFEKKHSL